MVEANKPAASLTRVWNPDRDPKSPHSAPLSEFVDFSSPRDERRREYMRFGEAPAHAAYFAALAQRYAALRARSSFLAELDRELSQQVRAASPLQHAARLSQSLGGAQLYFKREDQSAVRGSLQLAVTASALIARQLKRRQLVTGVVRGRCALYTATLAARLGLQAVIFVNDEFVSTRATEVMRMKLMGARIETLDAKTAGSRDPREHALQYASQHEHDSFLVMGLDAAPQPYGLMHNDITGLIGREALRQLDEQSGLSATTLVARGGNHADALGFLSAHLADQRLRLVCVQADAALHLQQSAGSDAAANVHHELSAHQHRIAQHILSGNDYPGVSREHARLKTSKRVEYVDHPGADETRAIIASCARLEGYVPPLETAQVIAWAAREAVCLAPHQAVLVMIAEDAERGMWDVVRAFGEVP